MGIAQNEGKKFEQDFSSSFGENFWVYRLRDNAASFGNGTNTRFASSNICDFIIYHDITQTLYLAECKSTKGTSIPYTMIKENQIKGLTKEGNTELFLALFLITEIRIMIHIL